jgi:hypothetical protein
VALSGKAGVQLPRLRTAEITDLASERPRSGFRFEARIGRRAQRLESEFTGRLLRYAGSPPNDGFAATRNSHNAMQARQLSARDNTTGGGEGKGG